MLRNSGTTRRVRNGGDPARRAGSGRRGRTTEGRGRGSTRRVLSPCLPQSRTRAAHPRDRRRDLSGGGGLALLGSGAGVPGILPGQHHAHQRRGAAHRGELSLQHRDPPAGRGAAGAASGHAVERRRPDVRGRPHQARVHGRIRTRGRGHRLRLSRRSPRIRQHPLLRHGRNHRQDGTRRARHADHHQGVRGRHRGPGRTRRKGSRLSHPHSGDRSGGDRRGRRLHRLGGLRWRAPGGTAKRRRRSRSRLLRERGNRAHHHGCEPGAEAPRSGPLSRRRDASRRGRGQAGGQGAVCGSARPGRGRGGARHRGDRQQRHGERATQDFGPAGPRPAGTSSWSRSAVPVPSTPTVSPRSSTSPPCWSP